MGGHGHGHGHSAPYVIPPHTQFRVKGIRQLEELEKALAKLNLKDPWIRNEAWRYHLAFGTRWSRAMKVFFRGFPLGCGVAALAAGAEMLIKMTDDSHGGHGGH